MKTDIKTLAALLATQVWCNGEFTEVEQETVGEIADAFEIEEEEFKKLTQESINSIEALEEDAATRFLMENANNVDDEEIALVYEAVMQMALCDGELTGNEVDNLLTVADALGMDNSTAILLLCDLVKSEPNLTISFEGEE